MPNSKLLLTIVGIIFAIFALFNVDKSVPIVENWQGMGSMTVTAIPGVKGPDGRVSAAGGNYIGNMNGSGKFFSNPNFQAMLSPRLDNNSYGASIRYNTPDRKNMAAPCDPLTFGDMAKENYTENYCGDGGCGGGSSVSCGKGGYGMGHNVAGGYELPSNYTSGNYQNVYDSLPGPVVSRPCDGESHSADLPVGTMSMMDSNGNVEQVVTFNRLMNTNMKSRKRGQGDYIRGDLPIPPHVGEWFNVNPMLNVDLNAGAMNVLNGVGSGETYNELMNLLVTSSGGARTTFGGVDLKQEMPNYRPNMANAALVNATQGMGDIQVSNFP